MMVGSHRKAASSCCAIVRCEIPASVSGIQAVSCERTVVVVGIMGILRTWC
jgi:hypothetical protein